MLISSGWLLASTSPTTIRLSGGFGWRLWVPASVEDVAAAAAASALRHLFPA